MCARLHRWYVRIQTDVYIRTKAAGRLLVCTTSKRRQPSCSYSSQPCMVQSYTTGVGTDDGSVSQSVTLNHTLSYRTPEIA